MQQKKYTILLVEKEFAISYLYREEFTIFASVENIEIDFLEYARGIDAISYLRSNEVDLIIVMLDLSDEAETILSHEYKVLCPATPVILQGRYSEVRFDKATADAYVTASGNMEELFACMRGFLALP